MRHLVRHYRYQQSFGSWRQTRDRRDLTGGWLGQGRQRRAHTGMIEKWVKLRLQVGHEITGLTVEQRTKRLGLLPGWDFQQLSPIYLQFILPLRLRQR